MKKKRYLFLIAIVAMTCLFPRQKVFANEAYKTFTVDGNQYFVESQTGYSAVKAINRIGDTRLSSPSDMRFGKDGNLYIADTGNRRVLVATKEGDYLNEFTHEELISPVGIFPHTSGKIFVADDAAGKIFVFTEDGALEHTFEKPTALSFGQRNTFQPTKVVVDERENVYALSRGNNNGIIMLNANTPGEFLGYFAPNVSQLSLLTRFRRAIFSEEQLDKMIRAIPNSAENLAIDDRGLIYTVTTTENEKEPLKKLNLGGTNLLPPNFAFLPRSVAVGEQGNIYVLSELGFIFEYTEEGELLFMFAGIDEGYQRNGLLGQGVAIDVDENNHIYTLDSQKNEIQIFQPTAFANKVHHALSLYQNGLYVESKPVWEEILDMNSQLDLANKGLGYAFYEEEDYQNSQIAFRQAQNIEGFSDAYWEVRNLWIKDNIVTMVIGVGIFGLVLLSIKWLDKKSAIFLPIKKGKEKVLRLTLVKQITYIFYFMKHPIDGAYGLKKENKTSGFAALILLFMTLLVYISEKYFSGFIFKRVADGRFMVAQDLMLFFALFSSVIICTYLVVTINDAEINSLQMYQGFIYCLGPYLLIKPFLIVISHVLTLNEAFILQFTNLIIYLWVFVLIVVMIKELNSYTVRVTIKLLFLTLFTIFISWLTIFVIYSLAAQVGSFIVSFYGEVVARIENF